MISLKLVLYEVTTLFMRLSFTFHPNRNRVQHLYAFDKVDIACTQMTLGEAITLEANRQ